MPWIKVAEDAPYFVTETGVAWTPIGQNDGIGWVDLEGLFRGRDRPAVEAYLGSLRDSGVTCLRLMLEHAQVRHRYLEKPVGRFVPNMVALWDDLFALCERAGLRILLTPFDTFWGWLHWKHHPYAGLQRRRGREARQLARRPTLPRGGQEPADLRRAAMGRQRRPVRLGPVERDPSRARRQQRRSTSTPSSRT